VLLLVPYLRINSGGSIAVVFDAGPDSATGHNGVGIWILSWREGGGIDQPGHDLRHGILIKSRASFRLRPLILDLHDFRLVHL
jgi:hypothetical protein